MDWCRRITKFCCFAAAAISIEVLAGWMVDSRTMKSVLPQFTTMKANTALGLLLSAAAVFESMLPFRSAWQRRLALFLALLAGTLGAITLAEYRFGLNLGIDQLLVSDPEHQ